MKTARALIHCGACLGAGILLAHSDGGSTATPPPAAAPAPASKPANPTGTWLMWAPPTRPVTVDAPAWNGSTGEGDSGGTSDADAGDSQDAEHIAEQTYLMNQEKQAHPHTENLNEEAREQAYAQDWMLRSYTDQLKKRHLENSDFTNPYLTADPLASSPGLASDPLLAEPADKKKPAARSPSAVSSIDDEKTLTPKKSLTSLAIQPLLGAFASTEPAARTDATADVGDGTLNSGASLLPVPNMRPPGGLTGSSDTSDSLLDMPGLTAASQGGIAMNNSIDFDDSDSGNRHRTATDNNFLAPTAQASDVTEFFKKQAEALAPPTVPGTTPTVVLPPKPRIVVNPEPTAKPAISGLRSHVDDPFDILQR